MDDPVVPIVAQSPGGVKHCGWLTTDSISGGEMEQVFACLIGQLICLYPLEIDPETEGDKLRHAVAVCDLEGTCTSVFSEYQQPEPHPSVSATTTAMATATGVSHFADDLEELTLEVEDESKRTRYGLSVVHPYRGEWLLYGPSLAACSEWLKMIQSNRLEGYEEFVVTDKNDEAEMRDADLHVQELLQSQSTEAQARAVEVQHQLEHDRALVQRLEKRIRKLKELLVQDKEILAANITEEKAVSELLKSFTEQENASTVARQTIANRTAQFQRSLIASDWQKLQALNLLPQDQKTGNTLNDDGEIATEIEIEMKLRQMSSEVLDQLAKELETTLYDFQQQDESPPESALVRQSRQKISAETCTVLMSLLGMGGKLRKEINSFQEDLLIKTQRKLQAFVAEQEQQQQQLS
jgi:hypothetical protein